MFRNLGAKWQTKKKEAQGPQSSSSSNNDNLVEPIQAQAPAEAATSAAAPSTSGGEHSSDDLYVCRSLALVTAGREGASTKRPREDVLDDKEQETVVDEEARAPSNAHQSGTEPVVVLLSENAFNVARSGAIDEVVALCNAIPEPLDLIGPSLLAAAAARKSYYVTRSTATDERVTVDMANLSPLLEGVLLAIWNHSALGCQPLASLSPSLQCIEDTIPAAKRKTFSEQLPPRAQQVWTALSLQESSPELQRAFLLLWVLKGLLKWRRIALETFLSYEVYRAETHQYSREEIRTQGSRIAEMRQSMREYASGHSALCRLLVALLHDLCVGGWRGQDNNGNSTNKHSSRNVAGGSAEEKTAPQLYLPDKLTVGLFRAACFSEDGDGAKIAEAEQSYYDAVIGSEKWRLGLYSAGDMHMRSSLEKTQRDRTKHLLNNEQAMASLHAFKRLLSWREVKFALPSLTR